ncbi:MAG: hypothetical protein Q7R35_10585, partial [Elusimicrobiota bacterium]|nr:hypothetical protein [Elusimicrobiota bacterium]
RHMKMRKLVSGWKTPGPTAVIEHGANPGLISHFAKKGLIDIADKLLSDKKVKGAKEFPTSRRLTPTTPDSLRPPRPVAWRSTAKFRQNTPHFGIIAVSADIMQIFAARKGGNLRI